MSENDKKELELQPASSERTASLGGRPTTLLELLNSDVPHMHRLHATLEHAQRESGITAVHLFAMSSEQVDAEMELIASRGEFEIPLPQQFSAANDQRQFSEEFEEHVIEYRPVSKFGMHSGWLATASLKNVSSKADTMLSRIAHFVGVSLERQDFQSKIDHYKSKCRLLGQINGLMAANSSLEDIAETVTREVAFRFSADMAVLFLRAKGETPELRAKATFGLNPDSSFPVLPLKDHSFAKVLTVGGVASILDLQTQRDPTMTFLTSEGLVSAHWGTIESRSEPLGALLLGFKQTRHLNDLERQMLEEFSTAAAVAVTNAVDRHRASLYTERLEEVVKERTKGLVVQRSRADEANNAKTQFVANMSHELRTPLTAIVGYSSVIARGVFGEINEPQRDALLSVSKAAEHLKDLLNEVLNVARVESGKETVKPSDVDVFALLKQIHRMMMQTASGEEIKLEAIEVPEAHQSEPLKAWIDQRHLRQILINLTSNAIKYTPSGGHVRLDAEVKGDKVKISVHDTGVGIPEKELTTLFDRFSRGRDEYSQAQVGTGLGLSLVKQLSEINGGQVGVESSEGEGSTFWVLVPLSKQNRDEEPQVIRAAQEHRQIERLDGLNILIADDSELTCEVLAKIIESVGGTPFIAHSVTQAIEVVESTQLDAALVDLAFPGESGLTLLDHFRESHEKSIAKTPLLVISACVFDSDRHEALQHGAASFIAKPFDPTDVVNLIRSLTTASMIDAEVESDLDAESEAS